MIANRYCQVDLDQEDACQMDDQGRFFSSQYDAVAEQYLCTPVNDNKMLKSVSKSASSKSIGFGVICIIATAIGYFLLQN